MIGLFLLCVLLLVFGGAVTEYTLSTADQLLQPDVYIQSVLSAQTK